MASLGHIAVGMAAGRWWSRPTQRGQRWGWMLAFSALSMLPDADVIAFALRIPYSAPFGHRGASHSLVAALACGALATAFGTWRLGALVAGVVASHGLLDTLTNGGLGVALLWPFSLERFFAPARPLPVAPLGARFLSSRGLFIAVVELLWFAPLWVYALWPRWRRTAA